MKVKAESSVFFIDGMSAQEEYDIVNRQMLRSRKEALGKLPGDRLLLTRKKLLETMKIDVIDLVYEESDERVFNLFVCLSRLPPFYNFLLNFSEGLHDVEEYRVISRLSKFLSSLLGGKRCDVTEILVEPDTTRYGDMYSELIRVVHDELCSKYVFEEDAWSTVGRAGPKFWNIYQEYSPVVEIFHGKAIVEDSQSQGISFEKIELSFDGVVTIEEAFASFLKREKYRITKIPLILTLVTDGVGQVRSLDDDLRIGESVFSLHTLITERNLSSYCYVKNDDEWYECGKNEVRKTGRRGEFIGKPTILFYVLKE